VVTGSVTGGVYALLGDGRGGLAAPAKIGSEMEQAFPNQVALGDLNGDHKLDIVVLNGLQGKRISVLLGNGSGGFTPGASYPLGAITNATSVLISDLNNDGQADVALTVNFPSAPGTITVFSGNGDGTLQSPVAYAPTGQVNQSLGVGDFNGDGLPDLAFVGGGMSTPTQVGVMFGKSDGTFQAPGGYGAPVAG